MIIAAYILFGLFVFFLVCVAFVGVYIKIKIGKPKFRFGQIICNQHDPEDIMVIMHVNYSLFSDYWYYTTTRSDALTGYIYPDYIMQHYKVIHEL